MGLLDLFSSLTSTVYADSEEQKEQQVPPQKEEAKEETKEDAKEEATEATEEAAEEAEEEEPEDVHPLIRDECKETKCAQLAKHFEHCQEKVQSGQGFKGEECIEELCM